ncbi:unnamed protein product [Cuscuta epithymum]|uniref:Uncharacterized protein n=1 Tax=Cuscuta epithymum TaxID=186058 RepID=A0AAV0G848_9ASTE|nr:unnamed protein product [Cuscuta epithymum]
MVEEELLAAGCRTPEREDCRIPAMASPPSPPRKKRSDCLGRGKRVAPPNNGYFQSAELDLFFARPPRRQVNGGQVVEKLFG